MYRTCSTGPAGTALLSHGPCSTTGVMLVAHRTGEGEGLRQSKDVTLQGCCTEVTFAAMNTSRRRQLLLLLLRPQR